MKPRGEMTREEVLQFLISHNSSSTNDAIVRRYNESLVVEPRMVGSVQATLETRFFSHSVKTPVMFGNFGGTEFMDGTPLYDLAEICGEAGTIMWVNDHVSPDDIRACIARGARVVQVVKPLLDTDAVAANARRAEDAGCITVACDINHGYGHGVEYKGPPLQTGPKSAEDLARIKAAVSVPFIVRGILSVHDALAVRQAGADGVFVSVHQEILRYVNPPLMVLPEIRAALGPNYPLFTDCCLDTGDDQFKALALGADLVSTSRPLLFALRDGGKEAVRELVDYNTAVLQAYFNRTGTPDIAHLDSSIIKRL